MLTDSQAQEKLDELLELKVQKLSTWECGFLADVEGLDGNFTDGQKEKIEEIWNRRIGGE